MVGITMYRSTEGRPACPNLVHLNLLDTAVIPYAVYEVITNHTLLREVDYESFEEVVDHEDPVLSYFRSFDASQ